MSSSTQYARLLSNAGLFKQILRGQGVPGKSVYIGEKCEEISLTIIGDSAFPRFSVLLKSFNSMTDSKE